MIIGVGIDTIEVDRLQKSLDQYGDRFLEHVFTPAEVAAAPPGLGRAGYFAARWAAKEAASKALGTGIGTQCAWKDLEVVKEASGKPTLKISGAAAETAQAQGIARFHLSYSHERSNACAIVIAESGV